MIEPGPVVSYRFDVFGVGGRSVLERDFYMADVLEMSAEDYRRFQDVPDFLDDAAKRWDHPQEAIMFTGRVKPGREEEARAWLGIE
jgi:hypothetical protein